MQLLSTRSLALGEASFLIFLLADTASPCLPPEDGLALLAVESIFCFSAPKRQIREEVCQLCPAVQF